MSTALFGIGFLLGLLLVPVCFLQLLYLEALRLRSREMPALELFKDSLEARFGYKLEHGAMGFSLIKQAMLLAMAILIFAGMETSGMKILGAGLPLWQVMLESIVVSFVCMLAVAHLAPQLLYRRTSGRWMLPFLPLMRVLFAVIRPLLALFLFLQSLADIGAPEEAAEENGGQNENIDALIAAGAEEGLIEEEDRKLIHSVVAFGDKTVREVMTARPQMVTVQAEATLEDLRRLVLREQYSRIPVYDNDIDRITGFVHVRDMFELEEGERSRRTVDELKRRIEFVPETKPVDDLLRLMQSQSMHMVIVVDEYGQTAGLATMEDLVEEIVGEIHDEHDPGKDVSQDSEGGYIVSGNLDLDRLEELLEFRPDEETQSTTVGGLVTEWLGHVPAAGEVITRNGIRIEVLSADDRRVSQVRLTRAEIKTHAFEQN
ncbi:MAG: HlyC/CorC family transporter [Acidimicrobiia bacterium]|nr:HlyC/CorC family transporter [Acidimicrobiia bacterium]